MKKKKSTFCCQTSHPYKRRTSHVYPWPTRQYSDFQLFQRGLHIQKVGGVRSAPPLDPTKLRWAPATRSTDRCGRIFTAAFVLFCFVSFRQPSSVPSGRPCVPPPPWNKIVLTAVRKISVVNRTTKTCRSTTRAEEKSVYLICVPKVFSGWLFFFFSCAWHVQCMYMVFV